MPPTLDTNLSAPPDHNWQTMQVAGAHIDAANERWRFVNESTDAGTYTNAQIDDYQGLPRRRFRWSAPLTLEVRARFSHPQGELIGTAGFGFWNDPFLMTGLRLPALPRAIWFFHASPHSNMKLALDTPGHGWKAATIDAIRLPFFLLAPSAPLAVPLMNIRPLYQALWPIAQRAIGVSEAPVATPITDWHTYRIEWGTDHACFTVDGDPVLDCDTSPRGRLGFVMWIDNQALTITPWGAFGWQALDIPHRQWLEIDHLRIAPGIK